MLKISIGIATGLLLFLLVSFFAKILVIGEPLSTHEISAKELSYNEETSCLEINGTVALASCRVSRVVWKQSEVNRNDVNVTIYGAETLPFQSEKKELKITVPDMKGKTAYLTCPDYDQLVTDGDFEINDFDIWISLDKPYLILIYDYQSGEYTDDYSIISR